LLTRRQSLFASARGFALIGMTQLGLASGAKAAGEFEIEHSDADWKKLLKPDQYAVLRKAATERPFSSPLDHEKRAGTFACAGCDLPAFSSKTKFDSGTGWPSFWAPLENAIGTSEDRSFGMVRTAAHCRRCGSHLGHIFNDGPPPTRLRYCMNGVAMTFKADSA
jgi:peptide-methionine (R)-S-oxide reductase